MATWDLMAAQVPAGEVWQCTECGWAERWPGRGLPPRCRGSKTRPHPLADTVLADDLDPEPNGPPASRFIP